MKEQYYFLLLLFIYLNWRNWKADTLFISKVAMHKAYCNLLEVRRRPTTNIVVACINCAFIIVITWKRETWMLFRISPFVFHRRKSDSVWNNMRASKWWQNSFMLYMRGERKKYSRLLPWRAGFSKTNAHTYANPNNITERRHRNRAVDRHSLKTRSSSVGVQQRTFKSLWIATKWSTVLSRCL